MFGSVLIVAYAATFRPTRTNVLMISGISLAVGLVFLFILMVDRPFKGEFSVADTDLVQLSGTFDRLDQLTMASQKTPRLR